jgi:hypothetical protein
MLLPSAAGASVSPLLNHTPPLHGTKHIAQTLVASGCGGSASFVVKPAFSLKTGVGLSDGKSTAIGCGPPGFSDYGATQGVTGFDSNAIVAGTPARNLSFIVFFNLSFRLSATPQSPAGGPFAWASAAWEIQEDLYDTTNSSLRYQCEYFSPPTSTNGTTSGTLNGTAGGTADCFYYSGPSATLTVTGHHYIVQIFAVVWEWAYAPSGTSTKASASLNMGTGVHQFTVQSWSLGP